MAKGSEYQFVVTDDRHEGPRLWAYDGDDDSSDQARDKDDDQTVYTVLFPRLVIDAVHVFEMALDEDGTGKVVLLRIFDSYDLAEHYARVQYQRYDGGPPFIRDGTDAAYHPTGKRQRIEDSEAEAAENDENGDIDYPTHDLTLTPGFDSEDLHWLVLMRGDGDWEGKSLNPFAVW